MADRAFFPRILAPLLLTLAGAPDAGAQPLPPPRPAQLDRPAADPAPFAPPKLAGGRARFLPLIEAEARPRGLPPEVADAVMRIESGYDSSVVGGVGERGLMQLLPSTAAMLGFKGTLEELAEPETNIRLGVRYLAEAWRLAGGDLCRTLMKYRAGHREERMSPLSAEYCRRAQSHLAAFGSSLGAGAPPAITFFPKTEAGIGPGGATDPGLAVRGRHRVVVDSERFWSAHRARVRAITSRLHARRGRLAAG